MAHPGPHDREAPPTGEKVRIYEVSPRDGLQNEPEVISTDYKLALITQLVHAGLKDIEVTSFVRPSWIPQLADARALVPRLPKVDGVRYWALIPNRRGLERALDVGVDHIATFMSASESHNKRNLNRTRRESLAGLRQVIALAKDEGMGVRSYLSTSFGCPVEGAVAAQQVRDHVIELLDAGADQIALADTTGMGNPQMVQSLIHTLVSTPGIELSHLSLHLHDTRGTALANAYAGWQMGIRTFDGAVAGVGGCPYAPGASGNAATEDLVHMFGAMELDTGIDLHRLSETGAFLANILQRPLPGRYHRYHRGLPQLAAKLA